MTNPLLRFAATACILCAGFGSAAGQDTAADLAEWAEVYEESRLELLAPVFDLQDHYARNLEKLRADATAAGQLERVLAVKAELDGFREGETPAAGDNFPEFKRLQDIYRQTLSDRRRQAAQALAPLTASYKKKLAELQTELTKQEKLAEALQVKAVFDALVAGEEDPTPAAAGPAAALNLAPVGTEESRGLTFTQGSLHFQLGNNATEFDFSAAEGITDFIDVSGSGGTWVALRQDGTAVGWSVANKAAFSRSGIAKLLYRSGGPGSPVVAITADGKIMELISGRIELDPAPKRVVDAAVLEHHAIALLDDATIHTWGSDYALDPKDQNYMPRPLAATRRNIAGVSGLRYGAMALDRNGNLHVWGRGNWVAPSIPRDLRNATAAWGLPFFWIVEVRGREHHLTERKDGQFRIVRQLPAELSMIRCGEAAALGLVRDRWMAVEDRGGGIATLGLTDAVKALDASALPFLWLSDNPEPRGYLLWLAEIQ